MVAQLNRGHNYDFPDHQVYDQAFFYRQGWRCIRHDGLGHVGHVLRNVDDLLAAAQPWPLSNEQRLRWLVVPANDAFALVIVTVLLGGVLLIRRRPAGWRSGEAQMLAHFLCVLPTAVIFYGDPRFRSLYDVFALALAAAIVADHFGLDRAPTQPGPTPGEGTVQMSIQFGRGEWNDGD